MWNSTNKKDGSHNFLRQLSTFGSSLTLLVIQIYDSSMGKFYGTSSLGSGNKTLKGKYLCQANIFTKHRRLQKIITKEIWKGFLRGQQVSHD